MFFVYVSDGLGNYVKAAFDTTGMSINAICEKQGYLHLFYTWSSKDYSVIVCFKLFSEDIICVISTVDKGSYISSNYVKKLLKDDEYSYDVAFDTYSRESELEEGIEGRYLTEEFMSEVTHSRLIGNSLVDTFNGYTYFFDSGILARYISNDGLVGFAKEMRETTIFLLVKRNAEKYYKTQNDIIAEINRQFKYYTLIPGNCLELVGSDKYGYDFGLLYLDIVHPNISIEEFSIITHNEAEKTRSNHYCTEMCFRGKYYCFDENKILTTKTYREEVGSATSPVHNKVTIGGREKELDLVYNLNGQVKNVCFEIRECRGLVDLFMNHCDCMLDNKKEKLRFVISQEASLVQAKDPNNGNIYFTSSNKFLLNLVSGGRTYLGELDNWAFTPDKKGYYVDLIFVQFG